MNRPWLTRYRAWLRNAYGCYQRERTLGSKSPARRNSCWVYMRGTRNPLALVRAVRSMVDRKGRSDTDRAGWSRPAPSS